MMNQRNASIRGWVGNIAITSLLLALVVALANPAAAAKRSAAHAQKAKNLQIEVAQAPPAKSPKEPRVPPSRETAKGIVFEDRNGDGKKQADEPAVAGVGVSDGDDIVETNAEGRWSLEITTDTTIFVIKPNGYSFPVNKYNIPQFYYNHRPEGSIVKRGLKPTGPLPESIDFPLIKAAETDDFRMLVLSDPQSGSTQDIGYLRDDVITELVGVQAAFGVVLGDLAGDGADSTDAYVRNAAKIGLPLFNVLGNHDENYDSPDDANSHESFTREFGPAYHSWDYGKVHFIALDTILWKGAGKGGGNYQGGIAPRIIKWAKKDLARTPKDRLIVLMMHIPVFSSEERMKGAKQFFELLEDRPNILALAGHTHTVEHYILDESDGWKGKGRFHEMVCTTGCGSWWSGPKDLRGIPTTDCRDGSPNGYTFLDFKGTNYTSVMKGAYLDANNQMRIYIPGTYEFEYDKPPTLLVNVFDGWSKSKVEYSLDGGPWTAMNWKSQPDPLIRAYYSGPMSTAKGWVRPDPSTHIWQAPFPKTLPGPNPHLITIRVKDIYGREIKQSRIFPYESE